ncbi:unnamed protein product [Fusarium equiseti]|uniref:Uncharacterized protein n=1 Tax=Fusarium equiseti TaxID=61235 RepID=A0A8J2NA97_FUSEQ|nr:unnamed protein product [Fusarium equiseti]
MDAPSSSSSSAQQSPSVQMVPQPAPTQGNNPSTAPFLQDFTLIAEAAKRAQMAIMIRDFEDCGLLLNQNLPYTTGGNKDESRTWLSTTFTAQRITTASSLEEICDSGMFG